SSPRPALFPYTTLFRSENLIFVRDQGAAWDLFTIGCYRNLKHYAEGSDLDPAETQAAAKAAGFDSPAAIGPYLRTLIALHRDTRSEEHTSELQSPYDLV